MVPPPYHLLQLFASTFSSSLNILSGLLNQPYNDSVSRIKQAARSGVFDFSSSR
jgi:hypothetical protein